MANIVDYVKWRGDLDFHAAPFNVVDAMVLCEAVYFGFDGVINADLNERKTLGEACSENVLDPLPSYLDEIDLELCRLIKENPRFSEIKAAGFVNEISEKDNVQFCAMTCFLGEDLTAIIFRGTDNSLVGWKENMDLAYNDEVPAQKRALQYLKNVADNVPGRLVVAGHSKGGNLAIYSAAFSEKELQDRIVRIFNFDGPGFNARVIQKENFQTILDKAVTFVPQDSVIGLLLEHKEPVSVVHSEETNGFAEHHLCTWTVVRNGVLKEEKISKSGENNRENLSEWIAGMSDEEKREFIKAAYELVEEYKTTEELFTVKNIWKVIQSYRSMTEEQKKSVSFAIGELKNTIIGNMKEKFLG